MAVSARVARRPTSSLPAQCRPDLVRIAANDVVTPVAYLFAVAVVAITVLFTLAADDQGLVVAVLGGTLAITPYVVVRAVEEVTNESVP